MAAIRGDNSETGGLMHRFPILRSLRARLFAAIVLIGLVPALIVQYSALSGAAAGTDGAAAARLWRTGLVTDAVLAAVVILIALVLSHLMVRPFDRLRGAIGDVKEGYSTKPVSAPAYLETEHIADAFNEVVGRMRELDASRQEFVTNVSHELKTPMTSMKVLADSLITQENVPAEMYREFLIDIDREIDRENNLISELLSLSRMQQDDARMNITEVNINELAAIILRRVQPLADQNGIGLALNSVREVTASVDEVKMTMIITNLVENAIKYNRENGRVTVTIDTDHKSFTIRVEDTGVGIPEASQGKVFERFYRVDKSRSRDVGGVGLGLSIVRTAVLLHRGTIQMESMEGEGTVFMVTIPVHYAGRERA